MFLFAHELSKRWGRDMRAPSKPHYRLQVRSGLFGDRWRVRRIYPSGREEHSLWYDECAAAVYSILVYRL